MWYKYVCEHVNEECRGSLSAQLEKKSAVNMCTALTWIYAFKAFIYISQQAAYLSNNLLHPAPHVLYISLPTCLALQLPRGEDWSRTLDSNKSKQNPYHKNKCRQPDVLLSWIDNVTSLLTKAPTFPDEVQTQCSCDCNEKVVYTL